MEDLQLRKEHHSSLYMDVTSKRSLESWNVLRRICMMLKDAETGINEGNFA